MVSKVWTPDLAGRSDAQVLPSAHVSESHLLLPANHIACVELFLHHKKNQFLMFIEIACMNALLVKVI